MFGVYKHNKYPQYRLIVLEGADLPAEIKEEWTLFQIIERIEADQEEAIAKSGWYLIGPANRETTKPAAP